MPNDVDEEYLADLDRIIMNLDRNNDVVMIRTLDPPRQRLVIVRNQEQAVRINYLNMLGFANQILRSCLMAAASIQIAMFGCKLIKKIYDFP